MTRGETVLERHLLAWSSHSWAQGFGTQGRNFHYYPENRNIKGINLERASWKMFICHAAAKVPCQLGGSSMGLNFSLCVPTGWLNLSSLSPNKRKSWWFEQMFCKLGAGSWCSRAAVCSLNRALSFALVLPVCAPILCLASSFSRGQRSQIARRREIQGRKSWQLVPDGEQFCCQEKQQWERVGRKDWRCLGLELPGQGWYGRVLGMQCWVRITACHAGCAGWEGSFPRGSQGSP